MPAPRGNLALVSTGDALYAIGGVDPSGNALATVTRYDIAQGMWTPVASLNTPRAGAVAAVIDGYKLKVPNWITFPLVIGRVCHGPVPPIK